MAPAGCKQTDKLHGKKRAENTVIMDVNGVKMQGFYFFK